MPSLYIRYPSTSGGGATIGQPVSGGTPNEVLYVDANGNLANSPNLTFDGTQLMVNGTLFNKYSIACADASSQMLRVDPSANFDSNQAFSYAFWIKRAVAGGGNAILCSRPQAASADPGIAVQYAAGVLTVFLVEDYPASYIQVHGSVTLTGDVWKHIVITYDGSSTAAGVKIYADGVAVSMSTDHDALAGSMLSPLDLCFFGAPSGSPSYSSGSLNSFGIYNAALSAGEVTELYNRGRGMAAKQASSVTKLVSLLLMGNSANDTTTTIKDQIATTDGTLTGGATIVVESP